MHNYAKVGSERKLESCSNRGGRGKRACILFLSTSMLLCTLQEGKALKAQTTNLISDNMGDRLVARKKPDITQLGDYASLKNFLDNDSITSMDLKLKSSKRDIIAWVYEINKSVENKVPKIDTKFIDTEKKGKGEETTYIIRLSRQPKPKIEGQGEQKNVEKAIEVKTLPEKIVEAKAPPVDVPVEVNKGAINKPEPEKKEVEIELPKELKYRSEFTNWFYNALEIAGSKGEYSVDFASYEIALRILNTIRSEFGDSVSEESKYVNKTMDLIFSIEKGEMGAKLLIKSKG